ncbi:MAG: hypothetical protein ACRERX_11115 [Pseudomonas sp.]
MMTRRRWAAVIVLVLVGLGVVLAQRGNSLPRSAWVVRLEKSTAELPADSNQRNRYSLQLQLGSALRRLHALELRDSLAAALAIQPRADATREQLLVLGRVTHLRADSIKNALAAQWRSLRVEDGKRSVAIAVSVDSTAWQGPAVETREPPGWDVVFTAPGPNSNAPCIAVVRAIERPASGGWQTQSLDDPELYQSSGLCAFYAAFGDPGSAIRRWLDEREYDVAREADWTSPLDLAQHRAGDLPLYGIHPLQRPSLGGDVAPVPIRTAFLRCSDGNIVECERLVLDPDLRLTEQHRTTYYRIAASSANSITTADTMKMVMNEAAWSSVIIDQLLNAMARSQGRERFTRFWQSSQPPAIAFQEATGTQLGEWVHLWVRHTLGRSSRGTDITPLPLLITLLLLSGGFAVAAFAAVRRSTA